MIYVIKVFVRMSETKSTNLKIYVQCTYALFYNNVLNFCSTTFILYTIRTYEYVYVIIYLVIVIETNTCTMYTETLLPHIDTCHMKQCCICAIFISHTYNQATSTKFQWLECDFSSKHKELCKAA